MYMDGGRDDLGYATGSTAGDGPNVTHLKDVMVTLLISLYDLPRCACLV